MWIGVVNLEPWVFIFEFSRQLDDVMTFTCTELRYRYE